MYSDHEISSMQKLAQTLPLKYPAGFINAAPDALRSILNGYGPDYWPEDLRKIVNWIFRHYPTAAAIHDWRYEFSDGRESARVAADAEFAANLILLWQNRYGWTRYFRPMAWFDYCKLRTAAILVRRFGCRAWQNSYRQKKFSGGAA